MINFSGIKNILWDFDGVLMNSMLIREKGFELVLKDYPHEQVQKLVAYHRQNGGLSRYVKFRYFFEKIREESITDERILELADAFSVIMKRELFNPELLIKDSVAFVEANHKRYAMHIVSGSDEKELRLICSNVGISDYFISIHGSPTPKRELVRHIISAFGYDPADTILIGDSFNDLEAAALNGISFYGYNNASFERDEINVIEKFLNEHA